jgi:hypothetical protein
MYFIHHLHCNFRLALIMDVDEPQLYDKKNQMNNTANKTMT